MDGAIGSLTPPEIVAAKAARALDDTALRTIFLEARTANGFLPVPVSRAQLDQIVELTELGPTSANCLPLRLVFVTSAAAKERLKPVLSPGNVDKTMLAPTTVIVAADAAFYELFPRTFPSRGEAMRANFAGPDKSATTAQFAWDNALLQMGYLTLAIRAVGLDAGPMGGFDRAKADAEFFPGGTLRSIFLMNIGYGDDTKLFPRLPRLAPAEVATFL